MNSKEILPLFQELGFADTSSMKPQDFCQATAALVGTDASLLDPFEIDFSLKKVFPPALAARCQAVPLTREEHHLCVALVDPFDGEALALLRFMLDEPIEQIVAPPERVKELLECYCSSESNSFTPVADHLEQLLEHAVATQASDLHLEPSEQGWTIRYRIDGVLQEHPSFSKSRGLAMVSRLKLMAHLDIAEQRRSQDGRLEYRSRNDRNSPSSAFRVATLPTQFGESLVLRLLDRRATCLDLEQLSFPPTVRKALLELLLEPYGLFIVTGPTGSGKTTTLYSCLQHLHHETIKIVTAEDPVEYELEGVLQIPINEAIGLSFPRTLRSLLRHDPDIIMVGETRDAATAKMALQASLTGHRVLTTLHTGDAAGAIARLLEMGGEATTLATVLRGVLAQRLLRTICPACRMAYQPGEKLLASLGLSHTPNDFHFYRGEGCDACQQTGYAGRQAIFELFLATDEIQNLIHQGASHLLLREKAIEQGMVPLRAEALRLLCEGITTAEEVLQWT
ncbi:MAG: GspE/PulE family protein [Chthoniobacterales bacterium]|nr:GspE/PulE family protein [Chthoniobacterales bacterium]